MLSGPAVTASSVLGRLKSMKDIIWLTKRTKVQLGLPTCGLRGCEDVDDLLGCLLIICDIY